MLPVHGGWNFLRGVSLLCFAALPAHAELVVDGRIDESEWENAIRCEGWRRTVPFARDEPRYRNDVRILSTEHGLAAAFILDQPPQERRIKPRTPRDAEAFIGDTVGLVVDFDANAQIGYEFAVALGGGVRDGLVTNQNKFDRDWDGTWQHAVRESADQWFVEMLVPWSSISMRESGADTRTIGIYASRYLFERGERYACPGISSDSEVFLSDFRRFTVSQYESAATFDFVPYATARSDLVNDHTQFKAGADITWKPSQNLRLAATLNPDFGQVESDELVVDFSAIETVFTDKRPFFTENQGIFDLRTPANGQLIYTRRIGAAPDDFSEGSSDIDVAFKLTGTANSLIYGAFMAQERDYRDDFGRLFSAARVALPFEHARVGYLGTWTDHPLLDRAASVNAIDYELTPNDWWRVSGQVIRSDISQAGASTDGHQAWLQTDFNRSAPLTHTLKLLYIDDRFDLNDLGYMERNSLRQVEWETNRRIVGAANPRINGESQRLYAYYRENELGQRLQSRLQLSRTVQYASNWLVYGELRYLTSGIDDLISRGNGPVEFDDRVHGYIDAVSPRFGDWQITMGAYGYQQGVRDYTGRLQLTTAWYPTEKLTMLLDLLPYYFDDWLLWEGDNLFGSYRGKRLDFALRADWIPAPRHELRVKWQWIGIDAEARAAYRTDADGRLLGAPQRLPPFTVNNLGLQVRYRYEIGPLSELFLVYARGGFNLLNDDDRSVGDLFGDMTDVRDADQFLIKVRYRL
jgi:Domain of unknown function (DUF5916)